MISKLVLQEGVFFHIFQLECLMDYVFYYIIIISVLFSWVKLSFSCHDLTLPENTSYGTMFKESYSRKHKKYVIFFHFQRKN